VRRIVFEWRDPPRFVAAGRFDLDYVRAHVGEQLGAMKTQRAGEIQDPISGQRGRLISFCHDDFLIGETHFQFLSTVTSDWGILSRRWKIYSSLTTLCWKW
jgi:hypothetical protein